MRLGNAVARLGAWTALAAMPCGAYALGRAAWWQWRTWPAVWDVDDAIVLAAAILGAVVATYLSASAAIMIASALVRRGRTIPARARALAPAAWQRVAAVALGIGLSSGLAVPAMASVQAPPGLGWADAADAHAQRADAVVVEDHRAHVTSTDDSHTAASIRLEWGAPVAESPVSEHALVSTPSPSMTGEAAPTTAREDSPATPAYVVQPGDSLWDITAALLGDSATDADIQHHWPLLYEANRATIGDNPSLIFAGTTLRVPAELAP